MSGGEDPKNSGTEAPDPSSPSVEQTNTQPSGVPTASAGGDAGQPPLTKQEAGEPGSSAVPETGFAPTDPTDGRDKLVWKSRWESEAKKSIRFEAGYLFTLFLVVPIGALATWLRWFEPLLVGIEESQYDTFALYAYSALGGLLGGTLFDIKWLYHTVAKGTWNRDRRLWRCLTPFVASGLAFAMLLLGTADLVPLLDTAELRQPEATMGVAFLIGYFSDNTIGAMARLASNLLGEKEETKSHHGREG